MGRNIATIALLGFSLVAFAAPPVYAGEREERIKAYKEYRQNLEEAGRKYIKGINDYQHPPQSEEEIKKQRKITGKVVEKIFDVPGLGKAIEIVDEDLSKPGGFYDQQRKRKEHKKRRR